MYKISFEISALFISLLCFVYCITAKNRQYIPPKGIKSKLGNQHFLFLMMLLTNMISSATSVIGVYLVGLEGGANLEFWQYFFHALYFIFHTTLSLAFGLYIFSVTGANLKMNKVVRILYYVPYIVAEILIFTNSLTGWCFYMDPVEGYKRGILMLLLYGIGAFYIVTGFVAFFINMRAISRSDRIAVGLFIIIATAGILVQAVRSDLLVELFFESLACLVIMIVLEEKSGHIDPTTGLLNRVAFVENNRRLIVTKQKYSIVLIKICDLDKYIKRFGVRIVDDFLMKVALFLGEEVSSLDVFACRREEFAVLFKDDKKIEAEEFANKVVSRFKKDWNFNLVKTLVDAVAVIVNIPENVSTYEELEDLLSANYQKDKSGSYIVPLQDIIEMGKLRTYEDALKRAIANNKLIVKYQPIYSIKKKKTISAEALVRIDDELLNDISPDTYIPVAEKTGLIKDIGLFVFEDVCRYLSDERIKNSQIEYIELNVSLYQFMDEDLINAFENIRKKYDIPSSKINLEITETGGSLERDEVLETLQRFRELGYTLSLDDFGTGYSNIVRTIKCKFENIKIDKTVLWTLSENDDGSETLRSLMAFIKNQGSAIIQEGVEVKKQFDLTVKCGSDYIQGFYFAGAISKEEFIEYLNQEAISLKEK